MKAEQDILSLIPQRPPFVIIDKLIDTNEKSGCSTFKISEQNIFVKNGVLTEPGLIENIAQTAAARIGYISLSENKAVPVGYIGAVQNLEIFDLPKIKEEIRTETTVDNEIYNVTIITGKVTCKEKLIASCNMKIYINQNKNPQA